MRNKKGFTLIEVAISVTLLSVVMVFMIKFVSIIKSDEDLIDIETDLILNKTIISRTIHEDIILANGIASLNCLTNTKCTIELNNGESRNLEIIMDGTTLVYKNTSNDEILLSKKNPNDYKFSLNKNETAYLYLLNIGVDSHPEYNIEIVNKKS